MALTVPQIAAIVVVAIDIIFFPFAVYGVYRYYTCRNHVILKKHYSEINLYMVTSSIMLFWSLQGLILVWGGILSSSYQQYFITPVGCFGTYSTIIFTWRCYMNYFSIKLSNAIDTEGWKQLINPLQSTTNFFIINKHTYGNYKYFYKHIIIIISIFNILWLILRLIFNPNEKLRLITIGGLAFIALSSSIILTGFIYCKTPNFGDIFFIHKEIKNMIMIFVYAVAGMAAVLVVNLFINNVIIKTVIRLFVTGSLSIVLIAGILLQTLWVIWKNKAWITVRLHGQSVLSIALELTDQVASNSFISKSPQSTSSNGENKFEFVQKCTVKDVLADRHGWNSFIFHLQKEFSVEILLSLLEMSQFKETVYSYYINQFKTDANINQWNESCFFMIPYPKTAKSHIVYGVLNELNINENYKKHMFNVKNDIFKKRKNELMIRAYVLYHKYIAMSAPFEINISSKCRSIFTKIMNNLNEWMNNEIMNDYSKKQIMLKYLFSLFDHCMKEMLDLLRNSFLRYSSTLLYAEFVKLWTKRIPKEETKKLKIPSTKQTILSTTPTDTDDIDENDIVLHEIYDESDEMP